MIVRIDTLKASISDTPTASVTTENDEIRWNEQSELDDLNEADNVGVTSCTIVLLVVRVVWKINGRSSANFDPR